MLMEKPVVMPVSCNRDLDMENRLTHLNVLIFSLLQKRHRRDIQLQNSFVY